MGIKQSNQGLQGYQENNQTLTKNNKFSTKNNQTWVKKYQKTIKFDQNGYKTQDLRARQRPEGAAEGGAFIKSTVLE